MNLKLAMKTTDHMRCNCCERIGHISAGKRCDGCKVFYCDSHVADLDQGLCPQCEQDQDWDKEGEAHQVYLDMRARR